MRSTSDLDEVFLLRACGLTQSQIARRTNVSQRTVSRWLAAGYDAVLTSPMRAVRAASEGCPDLCPRRETANHGHYAYLLGQYLGDGTLVRTRGRVHRLFITCCADYPAIIAECRRAIAAVLPTNAVGSRAKPGAVDITCYSTHWPCLLPQHGPGRKHTRPIVLEPWQAAIVLGSHPERFLRGLVHSDGCRTVNRVRGANGNRYSYARYMFTNRSDDVRGLFTAACDRLGVEWRQMNRYTVAVSRRASVARLDSFVGPKQ
ncbi:MAG: helix-turn-helix domain-containing protein [Acidimicrobiia bacterium]